MIAEHIKKLARSQDLSYEESYACMNEIMSGQTTPVQTAAFLTALGMKGETIEEITACAAGMRHHATPVHPHCETLEIVGTGGDGSNSFNISSTAAIVIAAAGQPVAKHGNRAASSACGAADCLEALGVKLDQKPQQAIKLLDTCGICFFFAQTYHTSMKYVAPVRKELGIRTVFNMLGPLTNPASPAYQVLGVYDELLVEPMADVLSGLGVTHALVVYNRDGMDEITSSHETVICEVDKTGRNTYCIRPEDFGIPRCQKDELRGGTPEENAQITRSVLANVAGPCLDTVVMNAGAALYVSGKSDSIASGIARATETIKSGAALRTLETYIRLSQNV